MANDHPNVLWIMSDHHRVDAQGAVDPSYVTPNIDDLAADGIRFTDCFCTTPQCSPSRSTLLTGRYAHQTGVQALPNWVSDDRYALKPSSNSVGRVFQEAGFDTAWFGRWDLGEGNVNALGWDTTDIDLTGTHGSETAALHRDQRTLSDATGYVTDHDGDSPFFLTASFNLPHYPYYEDEEFAGQFSREDVPIPESFDDDLADKPEPHRNYADQCGLTREQVREVGYRYRTMVSRVDAFVGELVETLRDEALLDDTVIVFNSDHGDALGAHRMSNIHTVAYEEVLRVPLVIRPPGGAQGEVVSDLVSTRSIPGTLVEAANLAVPDAFEGGSLYSPESREAATEGCVFFEHKHASGRLAPYRGVRTPNWKFVEYFDENGTELYDLSSDPNEMTNLSGLPKYADTEEQLQTTVREWWEETGGDADSWTEQIPD